MLGDRIGQFYWKEHSISLWSSFRALRGITACVFSCVHLHIFLGKHVLRFFALLKTELPWVSEVILSKGTTAKPAYLSLNPQDPCDGVGTNSCQVVL